MIKNDKKLTIFLNTTINDVFKVLPLYEEENETLDTYLDSLIKLFDGLDKAIDNNLGYEYISLLAILASIKEIASREGNQKPIVKREVFKCINLIKNMTDRIKGD